MGFPRLTYFSRTGLKTTRVLHTYCSPLEYEVYCRSTIIVFRGSAFMGGRICLAQAYTRILVFLGSWAFRCRSCSSILLLSYHMLASSRLILSTLDSGHERESSCAMQRDKYQSTSMSTSSSCPNRWVVQTYNQKAPSIHLLVLVVLFVVRGAFHYVFDILRCL